MTHPMIKATGAALALLAFGACSTVEDVIAYGKGPFDRAPVSRSETALEGLHESSWGNSGKWGGQEGQEGQLGKAHDEAAQGQVPAEKSPEKPPVKPSQ